MVDVNYKSGQEMMNLGYLNNDEVRKMSGEPAQGGVQTDQKDKEAPLVS
jgi:hypothetical protein